MDNYKKKTGIEWEKNMSTFTEEDFVSFDMSKSKVDMLATIKNGKTKVTSITKDSFKKFKKEQLGEDYTKKSASYFTKLLLLKPIRNKIIKDESSKNRYIESVEL